MTIQPEERVLDYIPSWDERNRDYAIRPLFSTAAPVASTRTYRYWTQGREVLDQGREGACVGFGWTGELMASPDRVNFVDPNAYARTVYRDAQMIDEWEGEAYEGTSVLAGAKVVQGHGLIGEYRWAFTIEDIAQTILEFGPVVIGVPWYESMYETRPSGLVESITGADRLVGGHCLLITGYSTKRRFSKEVRGKNYEVYKWRNSWGKDYGNNGSGYIQAEDLAKLFASYGEACVPLTRMAPRGKL